MNSASSERSSKATTPATPRWRVFAGGLALALWLLQMLGHGQGGQWAGMAFRYFGRQTGELLCVLGVIFVVCGAILSQVPRWLRLRESASEALSAFLKQWFAKVLVWVIFAVVIERVFVILHSELYHYVQFGFLAFLLYAAKPHASLVLVCAVLMGVGDELHQTYALYADDPHHLLLDWNDVMLNLVGGAGGVLAGQLFFDDIKKPRSAEQDPQADWQLVMLLLIVGGVVGGLCFYPGPRPFWTVWIFENNIERRYHETFWPEGVPLMCFGVAAWVLILGPWTRGRGVAALLCLALLAVPSLVQWRVCPERQQPRIPETFACRVSGSVNVDGVLDEESWQRCPKLPVVYLRNGNRAPLETTVQLAWDERGLYFAWTVPDQDVWAEPKDRDDPSLPGDEVVEMFLDLEGQGRRYFEIELSPRNQLYDLVITTTGDFDSKDFKFQGEASWNPKIDSAVKVNGRLRRKHEQATANKEGGWTAELFVPFSAFAELIKGFEKPRSGDLWRVNFSRVERPQGGEDKAQYLMWSPSKNPSFHRPKRFGRLFFSHKHGILRKH